MDIESDIPPQYSVTGLEKTVHNPTGEPFVPSAELNWARDLVNKLGRRSPMRLLINEILAGQRQKLPMEFLHSVLQDRSPKKWRERVLAAWALGAVPLEPDHVHGATMLLSEVLGGRIAHDRFGKGCARSYIIAFGIFAVVALPFTILERPFNPIAIVFSLLGSLVGGAFVSIPLGLAISPIVIPASMATDKKRLNFIRTYAARTLGRLQTPHSVAALAEAARDGDMAVRENALRSLRSQLPRLQSQHYGMLSRATVPALCYLLNQRDKQLRLELVEALNQVGDGRALGPVTRLHSITRDGEVKEAARRCMAVLAVRAENEKSAATLLRAAGAPGDGAEVLLRPAGASVDQDEAQLLRAVLADGEE